MSGGMPELPGPWLDGEKLAEFWMYVKWFMKYNMPAFMIVAAVFTVSMLITTIVDAPLEAKREQQGRSSRNRDDDEDFDVKYY